MSLRKKSLFPSKDINEEDLTVDELEVASNFTKIYKRSYH